MDKKADKEMLKEGIERRRSVRTEELCAKLGDELVSASSTKDLKLLKDKMDLEILQRTLKNDALSHPKGNSKAKTKKRELGSEDVSNSFEGRPAKFEEKKGLSPFNRTGNIHKARERSYDNVLPKNLSQKAIKKRKSSKKSLPKKAEAKSKRNVLACAIHRWSLRRN